MKGTARFMTFWERLIGSAGPAADATTLGALLARIGAALSKRERATGDGPAGDSPPHHRVAFTIAVVALGAKMAKADGLVNRLEVAAFKKVFEAPPGEQANVGRLFDLARQNIAGYQAYADQLGRLFAHERRLLQDVLEGLLHIAVADGALVDSEDAYLKDVAHRLGFGPTEFRRIRSRFVADDRDPYDVLKIEHDATDDEVKTQYRRLVAANHPDKMIARGVPQEFVAMASRKLAAINEAYATIVRERGLR